MKFTAAEQKGSHKVKFDSESFIYQNEDKNRIALN